VRSSSSARHRVLPYLFCLFGLLWGMLGFFDRNVSQVVVASTLEALVWFGWYEKASQSKFW